jgi:uncharacterized protein YbjT (DUF2867 family)
MILITGATGLLGREICQKLTDHHKPFRALVRETSDPDRVRQLKKLGAEIAVGDLKDPISLDQACRGISCIISTASALNSALDDDTIETVDVKGHVSLLKAAESNRVRQFIYMSFRENPDNRFPLSDAKRSMEKALKKSTIQWTSLQSCCFMDAWLSAAMGFDYIENRAKIFGAGEKPISWISCRDVATFAVKTIDNPLARNTVVEIGGPEALSPVEVVRIFEEISGKPFELEFVPKEDLQNEKITTVDARSRSLAGLKLQYAYGGVIDMEDTLRYLPVGMMHVEEYAEEVLSKAPEITSKQFIY